MRCTSMSQEQNAAHRTLHQATQETSTHTYGGQKRFCVRKRIARKRRPQPRKHFSTHTRDTKLNNNTYHGCGQKEGRLCAYSPSTLWLSQSALLLLTLLSFSHFVLFALFFHQTPKTRLTQKRGMGNRRCEVV